jgi:Bacterial Ig-like domain (group 3)
MLDYLHKSVGNLSRSGPLVRFLARRARLVLVGLLAFLVALAVMAVSAAACGSGGGGKESTTLTTKLSGESKEGTEITVLEGARVEDKATLSGKNVSKATGKVKYDVYSERECKTLVTAAGEGTVSGESVTASEEKTLEAGKTYYWQATYEGNESNSGSTSSCGSEILNVQAKTTLATKLSGESKEGEVLEVKVEQAVKDAATLSGTNSSTATGKVTYKLYADEQCTELVAEAGEVTLETGGKVPTSTTETLPGGTYFWQASYAGDALHQSSTSTCGSEVEISADETSVTTALTSESSEGTTVEVSEAAPVTDTVTLHGEKASTATGTVTFNIYSDSECRDLVVELDEEPVAEGQVPVSLPALLAAGTYYWQAVYSGDANDRPSTSTCGSETEIVGPPALTTSLSGESKTGELLEVQTSAEVGDAATLHTESPSTATGTVTYRVYSDSECTKLVANAGEVTLEAGGKIPSSHKETLAAGTYYWQAVYSGDAKHKAETSVCGSESEVVAEATTITTSLKGEAKSGESLEVQEQANVTDTATLHGTDAATATGSVTYNVYSDSKCEDLVASAGEETVASGSAPSSSEEALPAGTYYWQAVYSGDSSNQPSTSTCGAEVETIAGLTTSLSGDGKTGEILEVQEEEPVTDTATLHGATASTATGTVEYNLYSDSKCEHLVASAGEGTMKEGVASSSKEETPAAGTYYWQADYKGDEKHPSQNSVCGLEQQRVQRNPAVWVVSLGDSFISGEGGRWAGNTATTGEHRFIDALGPDAYFGYPNNLNGDEAGAEEIPLCHRSKSAEIFIGGGIRSKNYACSGGETLSASEQIKETNRGVIISGVFKPGLDFVRVRRGQAIKEGRGPNRGRCPLNECVGQAKKLEEFASQRKANREGISMVALSIGGNDFQFGPIIRACVAAYLNPLGRACSTSQARNFERVPVEEKEKAIEEAINRVGQAMENARFARNEYTIVVQDYPSPIPANATEFRYRENELTLLAGPFGRLRPGRGLGLVARRIVPGACPFRNGDAEWANATALKKINETVKKAFERVRAARRYQVAFLELEGAFSPSATEAQGRRLCERGLRLIGGEAFRRGAPETWLAPGRGLPTTVNETEWINSLRFRTWNVLGFQGTPFLLQEDIHPNFWGQLALRSCLRREYNGGVPKEEGRCVIERQGLTANGGGPLPAAVGEPPVVRNEPLMLLH